MYSFQREPKQSSPVAYRQLQQIAIQDLQNYHALAKKTKHLQACYSLGWTRALLRTTDAAWQQLRVDLQATFQTSKSHRTLKSMST